MIDKLNRIKNTKEAIITSVNNKGVECGNIFNDISNAITKIKPKIPYELYIESAPTSFSIHNGIKEIILPENMENVTSLNFANSLIRTLYIPATPLVSNISESFSNCLELEELTIEDISSCTSFFYGAFYNCKKLKTLIIKGTLNELENINSAFLSCVSLVNLQIPPMPNLNVLDNAFGNCLLLESLDLSKCTNIKSLNGAFSKCTNLSDLKLPESLPNVTSLNNLFNNCTSLNNPARYLNIFDLTKIKLMVSTFTNTNITEFIFSEEMSNLKTLNSTFSTCVYLESVVFNNTLLEVTDCSKLFFNTPLLRSINLPNSMPKLQNISYMISASNIERIVIPNDSVIDTIEYFASSNKSVTYIELPDLSKVTSIRNLVDKCISLVDFVINGSLPKIDMSTIGFSSCPLSVDSLLNILNALPDITNDAVAGEPLVLICTLGTTNLAKLTPEQIAIGTDKGWTID